MTFRPFLLIAIMLAGGSASAADASASDVAKARAHYDVGTRFYDLGQYDKALEEYRAAYAQRPDPVLLFNVAQCLRKLRRLDEALDMYRSFLRRAPHASNRADVEHIMNALEQEIARQPKAVAPPPEMVTAPPSLAPPPPPPPSLKPSSASLSVSESPAPVASTPLVKRPWFWGVVAVVAAGAVTGVLLSTRHTARSFSCSDCIAVGQVPTP